MSRARLENGTHVLIAHDVRPDTGLVLVHHAVGSGDDPPGYRGLAHLTEHMELRAGNVQWFAQSHYRPERTTVVVVSALPEREAHALVAKYFAPIRATGQARSRRPIEPVQPLKGTTKLRVDDHAAEDPAAVVSCSTPELRGCAQARRSRSARPTSTSLLGLGVPSGRTTAP